MKKRKTAMLVALALSAVAWAPAGSGSAARARVEEQRYKAGTYGAQNVAATCPIPSFNWSDCYLVFHAGKGERSFRAQVFDDVSPAAMIRVYIDSDNNGMSETYVDVCGTSDRLRIRPYARLSVIVWAHPYSDPSNDDSCVGNSTSGVVRMTFFR